MGGSIAFTIREEDGTEHRMCRWTNIIPWAVTNLDLIENPESHLREVLVEWEKMRADYEGNRGEPPFAYDMTDMYAPHPHLAPHSYGLVVVDMKEKVILECNGYTQPGRIYTAGVQREGPKRETFLRFADAGRVKYEFLEDPVGSLPDMTGWTGQDHLTWLKTHPGVYGDAICDMSPYHVETFPETREGFESLYSRVKELGFVLSQEEENLWTEFIAER